MNDRPEEREAKYREWSQRGARLDGGEVLDAFQCMRDLLDLLDDARAALAEMKERAETHEKFAVVADAYCWDPETTTHADLMNARAAWQSEIGRQRLAALSSPETDR